MRGALLGTGCALLLTAAAGCGGDADPAPQRPADPPAAGTGSSTLVVFWRTPGGGPRPIEGYLPYLELRRGGERVLRRSFPRFLEDLPVLLRRQLPAGRYLVRAWYRTGCGANCYDPPSEVCTRRFRIRAGAVRRLTVLPRFNASCRVLRGALSDYVGLTERKAEARARRHGLQLRVVERDGEELFVTRDLRADRLNVAVRGGRVVRVDGLY